MVSDKTLRVWYRSRMNGIAKAKKLGHYKHNGNVLDSNLAIKVVHTYDDGNNGLTQKQVCHLYHISRSTLNNYRKWYSKEALHEKV